MDYIYYILIGILALVLFVVVKFDPLKKHFDSIPDEELKEYKKNDIGTTGGIGGISH